MRESCRSQGLSFFHCNLVSFCPNFSLHDIEIVAGHIFLGKNNFLTVLFSHGGPKKKNCLKNESGRLQAEGVVALSSSLGKIRN